MINNRIKTLEGLRALAFLGVVLSHTDFDIFRGVGTWAVSIFFILSGFVAVISYKQTDNDKPSIKNNFKYLWRKIKKLYPLHILMTLCMALFDVIGEYKEPIWNILIKLSTNILLIQAWFPIAKISYNGVSWFLCVIVFFNFIFLWYIKNNKNGKTNRKAIISIIFLLVLQTAVSRLACYIPSPAYSKDMILVHNLTSWFAYYYPPIRIIDMFIGCNLAFIYKNIKDNNSIDLTWLELISLILALFAMYIYFYMIYVRYYTVEPIAVKETWWCYSILFAPSSIALVLLFALGKGRISKLFSNRIGMYLAKISPYAFLIHNVVFLYIHAILQKLPFIDKQFIVNYEPYIRMTIGFIITLILTNTWIKITKKKPSN